MALQFGDRETLVAEGKKRVTNLLAKGASNAYLYGENELGGLHVLSVLDDSPETYGLPRNPSISGITMAWQDVIQPMGWVLGGLTIVGLGLNFMVAREAKMTRELPGRQKKEN
jgi:formate dehydrogenase iron-sulfur subunit